MSHPQIQTTPKFRWGGYTDASDEEGRNTPSTETRTLYAIVFVYLLPNGLPDFARMDREADFSKTPRSGYLIDYRHSASRQHAIVEHVLWAENRGLRRDVHYEIWECAEAIGVFSRDEHGDHLYT
jgi:hypothetical protein